MSALEQGHQKVHIITYGCQMNVYDSQRMGELLSVVGYQPTDAIEDAGMVVLNTCHIREKAAEKMYSELGRMKQQKEKFRLEGKKFLIVVAGCVGQAEGEEIIRRAPYVDIVTGPQSYHTLPDLVAKVTRDAGHAVNLDFPAVSKFDELPKTLKTKAVSQFLTVQEGCDKFCTFCVVPYTRGAEYSRPLAEIYREALGFVSQGTREITLLGQNVNAYHGVDPDGVSVDLARLLEKISEIPGLDRLRYTTSHPNDMNDALIHAHATIEKLMPYLHLPIQAGSDRILKAMNRKHQAKEYIKIIEQLRKVRPDIALSSDFIVGFPGETEEDFKQTLAIVDEVGYASAYSFKYSPRPGTPGALLSEQVDEEVKTERLARLQELLNRQQLQFNQQVVGKILPVLIEKKGKYPDQWVGKSPYLQSVHLTSPKNLLGQMINVTITDGFANSISGSMASFTKQTRDHDEKACC